MRCDEGLRLRRRCSSWCVIDDPTKTFKCSIARCTNTFVANCKPLHTSSKLNTLFFYHVQEEADGRCLSCMRRHINKLTTPDQAAFATQVERPPPDRRPDHRRLWHPSARRLSYKCRPRRQGSFDRWPYRATEVAPSRECPLSALHNYSRPRPEAGVRDDIRGQP